MKFLVCANSESIPKEVFIILNMSKGVGIIQMNLDVMITICMGRINKQNKSLNL